MRPLVLALLMLAGCKKAPEAAAEAPPPAQEVAVETSPREAPVSHPWLDVPARRVEVNGTRLFILDTGGEGTPILLVHGLGSNLSFWQRQLTGDLATRHRLIAVDLPGWGRSDQPDGPYTPSWYAEHLVGLLDALDVDKAHVAGHSMGGQAVLTLALDHPDRVDRLILSAPAGIETFTEAEAAPLRTFWTRDKLEGRSREATTFAFSFVFADMNEDVQKLVDERMTLDEGERFEGLLRAVQRSVHGMLDEPVFDRLGDVKAPTLVVFGEADAMIPARALHPDMTPVMVGQAAVDAIPDAVLVTLPDAGHTPHHDDPVRFDAAVEAFLGDDIPTP